MKVIRPLLLGLILTLLFWGCGYQSGFAPDLGATTAAPTPAPNNQCQPTYYSWPGNGTWTQVGQADFGGSGGATYLSLAISPCGAPYVAFVDGVSQNVNVKAYNGSSWVTVGAPDFGGGGGAAFSSIAFNSSGTPYVAFQDAANNNSATVMSFDGTNWNVVGTPGFAGAHFDQIFLSLAVSQSGTPYVFFDFDDGSILNPGYGTVMNFDGTNWNLVGAARFTGVAVTNTSIAIDSTGTPYVSFQHPKIGQCASCDGVDLMSFDGTNWNGLTGADHDSSSPAIAINPSNIPYMIFVDGLSGDDLSVGEYVASSFNYVGSEGFSSASAGSNSIAIDSSGKPYIAFIDKNNNSNITAMTFDGTNWNVLGSAGFGGSGNAQGTAIALDSHGTPYTAYIDGSSGDVNVYGY